MLEMLGVLAIIGVLSVGGITGYSKAMKMYKLNIQAQEMNYLINLLLEYRDKIKTSPLNLTQNFADMNLLPEHFTTENKSIFYDIMNNQVHAYKIYHENCALTSLGCDYLGITVTLYPESDLDNCRIY